MPVTALVPDWGAIRDKTQQQPWAAACVRALREQYTYWRPFLQQPTPSQLSEWTHHYFCDTDGTRLTFAPDLPHRHVCSTCGHAYSGKPWDGAWTTLMHNAIGAQAERAAVLIHLGSADEARAATRDLLGFLRGYAAHYSLYPVHGEHAGKGRIMPQNLDESILLTGLLRALRWSGLQPDNILQESLRTMATEAVALLRPQIGAIHNIHCWMLAAIAAAAAILEDESLLQWCLRGPHGIENQIMQGLLAEGLWYEINAGYHYYSVQALLSCLEIVGADSLSEAARQRLALAVNNPPQLAYPNGLLPAYADGWPLHTVSRYADQAELAYRLLGSELVDLPLYYRNAEPSLFKLYFEAQVRAGAEPLLHSRGSTAALLFGPASLPAHGTCKQPASACSTTAATASTNSDSSFLWPDAGIAVLRGESVRLAIRFGKDGGWHDHRDKLNVDADAQRPGTPGWQSLDLGTSGYGAEFTQWLRSPLAHNLIIVNGQHQAPHSGELLAFSNDHIKARSQFDGKVFERELRILSHSVSWSDTYSVRITGQDTAAVAATAAAGIVWVFHGDGHFLAQPESAATPKNPPAENPAEILQKHLHRLSADLRWLSNITALPVHEGILTGSWQTAEKQSAMTLRLKIPPNFTAFCAQAAGNPNQRALGLVIVCGRANEATFAAQFQA